MIASTARLAIGDDEESRSDLWRAAQFGVLWGLAITTMESRSSWAVLINDVPLFLVMLVPYWCLKSGLLAYAALRLERRHRGASLVGWMSLAAVAQSVVSMAWLTLIFPKIGIYDRGVQPVAIFWYDAWSTLFYGSVLVVGCVVARRASRTRHLLKQAEIDRGLTDAMVTEIRLKELQGSVNPEVLYDALAEVLRRYVAGSPTADGLLDGLVGFLRTAMPSLRESASTLAAEMELARAYMRLRQELYPERGAWRIEGADDLGTLRFPSLQLIELVDRWTRSTADPAGGVMAITRCDGGVRVELHANVQRDVAAELASNPNPFSMIQFFNAAQSSNTG